jgi:hypothetical protein
VTTTRSFTCSRPATLQLHLPAGNAHITVDPTTEEATVRVVTADNTGPAADAVNGTTEDTCGSQYTVRVPGSPATSTTHFASAGRGGGNRVVANNNYAGGGQIISGGDINVVQRIGTVAPGSEVVGLYIDTRQPAAPTLAATAAASSIRVVATVPPGTAVEVIGEATDVGVRGQLETLTLRTTTGSLTADGTADLTVQTSEADIHVGQVRRSMDIRTLSGGVTVDDYRGVHGTVATMVGDITVDVTATATGRLQLASMSGDVTVTGTAALDDLTATSVSGKTRQSR